jgi:hypothetical protein
MQCKVSGSPLHSNGVPCVCRFAGTIECEDFLPVLHRSQVKGRKCGKRVKTAFRYYWDLVNCPPPTCQPAQQICKWKVTFMPANVMPEIATSWFPSVSTTHCQNQHHSTQELEVCGLFPQERKLTTSKKKMKAIHKHITHTNPLENVYSCDQQTSPRFAGSYIILHIWRGECHALGGGERGIWEQDLIHPIYSSCMISMSWCACPRH